MEEREEIPEQKREAVELLASSNVVGGSYVPPHMRGQVGVFLVNWITLIESQDNQWQVLPQSSFPGWGSCCRRSHWSEASSTKGKVSSFTVIHRFLINEVSIFFLPGLWRPQTLAARCTSPPWAIVRTRRLRELGANRECCVLACCAPVCCDDFGQRYCTKLKNDRHELNKRKYLLGILLIWFSRINSIALHNLQKMQKVLTTRSAIDLFFQCTRWRRCFRGGEGRGEAGGRHFFLFSTSTNIETAILSRHINVAVYYHSHCPFLFVTPSFSGIGSVYRVKSAHAGQQVRRSGCWIKTKGGLQVISCNDYQGINGKGECHWCLCFFSQKCSTTWAEGRYPGFESECFWQRQCCARNSKKFSYLLLIYCEGASSGAVMHLLCPGGEILIEPCQ